MKKTYLLTVIVFTILMSLNIIYVNNVFSYQAPASVESGCASPCLGKCSCSGSNCSGKGGSCPGTASCGCGSDSCSIECTR
jgi:hypothetical protein